MICSVLRQIAALALLCSGMLHLGMGLKLTVFQETAYGVQPLFVVPLVLMGFGLWAAGCKLATTGATAMIDSPSCGSILHFPASRKTELNEACSKAAA